MSTKKILFSAVALAAALLSPVAKGQSVPATFAEISPSLVIKGTFDDFTYYDLLSGVISFDAFDAFCVEPFQPIDHEPLVYQIQDPASLANHDEIARLVGGYLGSAGTNQDAAAVQWAIWEIIVDGVESPSLTSGNVKISPHNESVAELAQHYLDNLRTFTPASLTYLTHPSQQDMVTWQIPEPGTLGLAVLSLVTLLRRRR